MLNIIIFGPPGCGKGTQSEFLVNQYNLKHLSTGDIFRENIKNKTDLGIEAKKYIDQGQLVPDFITIDMLGKKMRSTLSFPKNTFLQPFITCRAVIHIPGPKRNAVPVPSVSRKEIGILIV